MSFRILQNLTHVILSTDSISMHEPSPANLQNMGRPSRRIPLPLYQNKRFHFDGEDKDVNIPGDKEDESDMDDDDSGVSESICKWVEH